MCTTQKWEGITPKSRHNIPLTPMPHDLYRFGS